MKALASCLLACSLLTGLTGIAALTVTANAQPATSAPDAHAKSMPTDVSTAKRKHRAHYRAYYGQWHAGNPNYGPGTRQLRAHQRSGACVIDDGYGRYSACPNQ